MKTENTSVTTTTSTRIAIIISIKVSNLRIDTKKSVNEENISKHARWRQDF